MDIKASLNNLRMSARKVRLAADIIRKLPTAAALDQLKFMNKKAAQPVAKLLKSAIANAVNNFDLDKDNLFVKEIKVDEGRTLHRWAPKAHGRATAIRKRGAHINITLGEIKESGQKAAKKQTIEAPIKLETLVNAKEPAAPKKIKADTKKVKASEEVVMETVDREEGRHGHAKIEGRTHKGFSSKMFRRKSG
jgi:large subunit ribosomal protein L22